MRLEVKKIPTLPLFEIVIAPPEPPVLVFIYIRACSVAVFGSSPFSINPVMWRHRQTRAIVSPCPVAEHAPIESSQYPPHQTRGVSPTLPGIFPVIPPVEVAHATCPFWSTATAPTVPYFFSPCLD